MAGRTFEGCVEAREISLTRKGANEHAVILVRKNMAPEANPEKIDMDVLKALAAMNDETRAYFLTLKTEETQKAFLAKKPEEQGAEVEKAAAAVVEPVVDAADIAKTATTVAEMQKAFSLQQKQLDDIVAKGVEDRATAEIEKRARTEFAAYPGGEAKVVPLLKAYSKLSEEDRLASEGVLKTQCEFAKRAGAQLTLVTEDEYAAAAPASAEVAKRAQELAKEKGVTEQVAKGLLLRDPANSDLFARVQAEEARVQVA